MEGNVLINSFMSNNLKKNVNLFFKSWTYDDKSIKLEKKSLSTSETVSNKDWSFARKFNKYIIFQKINVI